MRLFISENLCSIITFSLARYRILIGIYFPPNLKINLFFFFSSNIQCCHWAVNYHSHFWSLLIVFSPHSRGFKIFVYFQCFEISWWCTLMWVYFYSLCWTFRGSFNLKAVYFSSWKYSSIVFSCLELVNIITVWSFSSLFSPESSNKLFLLYF